MLSWQTLPTRVRERNANSNRPSVFGGVGSAHQLPRNASSVPCLSILPADTRGHHVLVRSDSRSVVSHIKLQGLSRLEAPLHTGERPSCGGSDRSALTEGDAYAGKMNQGGQGLFIRHILNYTGYNQKWNVNQDRSRHVVKEQCLFRGMDTPPALGSENVGSLWQSSSRPLRLRRQLSLPNLFHKEHGCPSPLVTQSSALCFSSNCSAPAGTQASQGATAQAYSKIPPLEEPAVGVGVIPAARSSLSQANGTIWHPWPEL